MDLSGPWRAAPLDPELNRSGADPDLDDGAWATIHVPGHWAGSPLFDRIDGPLLYRRNFHATRPDDDRRSWLCLDGVMARSEVWLDGEYLGDTEGYFVPHRFEITDALDRSEDHVLAIEVACPEQNHARARTTLTGSLQSGPLAPPGNPGGIWRPVRVEETGPVTIRWSRLLCSHADAERAELRIRLVLDALHPGDHRIDTSVTGPDGTASAGGATVHTLAQGENRIEWTIPVENPSLWWPHALGDQPLYEVAVAVRTADQAVSDRRHWRTGLRRIEASSLRVEVNGERLFLKGVSLGPQHRFLAELDPAVIAHDLTAAREAGFDLVRVHGHVARSELYEAADRDGLLLWQDLPLVGANARSTRKRARMIARAAVDVLGHHPSIALWCTHEEPNGPPFPEPVPRQPEPPSVGRRLLRHLAPSWNRSVLDPLLRREVRSADPTRPVMAHSGSLPLITEPSGSDSHLWLGWHSGTARNLADLLRQWPRLGTFVGGFGSQSPVLEDWDENEPTWSTAQRGAFERYVPRSAYGSGEAWASAAQAYQSDLLRHHIETIRRVKFRPAGGFCLMALADAEESGGFGLLDHRRRRKPAYNAVLDACRPVVVIADTPPAVTTPGSSLSLAIHAVSDLNHPLGDVRVTAVARCGAWTQRHEWEGDLPANGCEYVATLDLVVPAVHGTLVIDLHLLSRDRVASNRYQTVVIPVAESTSRSDTDAIRR